ncbi:EAL domain-containing response regulator [Planctobacterium marinum]|uniref:Uncharacterized protein n=1 Tax=Planctobacterium marinum TaxID=1631968 RepID=A0AA48HJ51_9ALTE|nr:hypothetical protein MACH26_11870 [Planctobacterium marinum]
MENLDINKKEQVSGSLESEPSYVYGCKILLVDDQPITTDMLEAMFKPLGFDTLAVNDSLLVLDALQEFEADLILLDVHMPHKTGLEISTELKNSKHLSHIPIILLTAMDDKNAVVKGLSCGVQDYVTKPFHKAELTARVINNLRLKKQQDFWRLNHKLIREQFDVSGLPLQSTFHQYLEKFTTHSREPLTLAIFSIYAFDEIVASMKSSNIRSTINTTIYERLNQNDSRQIFVGNLGEGKFGVLFLQNSKQINDDLMELQECLERYILISDSRIKLKVNVGFCVSRCNPGNWREMLEKAEIALLKAKQPGSPSIVKYSPKSHGELNDKWWVLHYLDEAIEKNEITVQFQPQFDLYSWECTGYEALARWHSKMRGTVYPEKFIPIAEQHGLIERLSFQIFDQALRYLPKLPGPKVALNISPLQLHNPAFPVLLTESLEKHGVSLKQVELELTESSMMDERLIGVVEQLMKIGYEVVIDDFGTGYSNLSILTRLPFSKIKVDRSLIRQIHVCQKSEALVTSMVSFCTKFGMKVLAEGVENSAQADVLRAIGVDEVQGFLFGKPRAMPASPPKRSIKHVEIPCVH